MTDMEEKYRSVLEHFARLLREVADDAPPRKPSAYGKSPDLFEDGRQLGLHTAASLLAESLRVFGVPAANVDAVGFEGLLLSDRDPPKAGPPPQTGSAEAVVLSDATNVAVVQLPGRRFPASAIQGDSLANLHSLALDLRRRASQSTDEELADTATELHELLHARLLHYQQVLLANGRTLPYSPRIGDACGARVRAVVIPQPPPRKNPAPMLKLTRERVVIVLFTALLLWSWGPTAPHVAAAVVGVVFFWWFVGPSERPGPEPQQPPA